MNGYSMGIASGIIFAFLFFVILFIVQKSRGKDAIEKYDERQLQARFKAYQTGFFVLVFGVCADACIKMLGAAFYEDPLGEFAALLIAVGFFAVQAIRHDAFIALNRSSKNTLILYGIIVFAQLINAANSITSGELVRDGKLSIHCVSLLCSGLFIMVFVMVLIKYRRGQAEGEDE